MLAVLTATLWHVSLWNSNVHKLARWVIYSSPSGLQSWGLFRFKFKPDRSRRMFYTSFESIQYVAAIVFIHELILRVLLVYLVLTTLKTYPRGDTIYFLDSRHYVWLLIQLRVSGGSHCYQELFYKIVRAPIAYGHRWDINEYRRFVLYHDTE